MSIVSRIVNITFGMNDKKRDKGLVEPQSVVAYKDISYGEDELNVLDVYRPKDKEGERLPVIVNVHGGGWVYGDKELYRFYCMDLSLRGFAVVNFSYRLAPKHRYPSQVKDTATVFNWVKDNAERYGFDLENLFAVGDSAGAQILATYCNICTNEEYARSFEFAKYGTLTPKAVGLNCGVYDQVFANESKSITTMLMKDLLGRKPSEDDLILLSVNRHVTNKFPPSFVMTATGDFVRMQAPQLTKVLEERGVPFTFKIYGDDKNRLPHVFHVDMKSEDGRACNDDEIEFFKTFIN